MEVKSQASIAVVVDHNDGTADFFKRRPSSAVSICLLRDGTPVLGSCG